MYPIGSNKIIKKKGDEREGKNKIERKKEFNSCYLEYVKPDNFGGTLL